MLQRLTQFGITFLDLFEQPHILDRDHGLVGKCLQQRNLFFCKRTDLHPPERDRPDRRAFA